MTEVYITLAFGAGCFIGGYWLATHIHAVATAAASAISRATTVHINPTVDAAAKAAGTMAVNEVNKVAGT